MEITCAVCSAQKAELHRKRSKILTKTEYLTCTQCQQNGLEPRWIVVLGFRAGNEEAKKFVLHKAYLGQEIALREAL